MTTLELFSGTKSFSKVMTMNGHETMTIDNDPKLDPDYVIDILTLNANSVGVLGEDIDILWASPPCEGFSVAVIGRNWHHDHTPKTDNARRASRLAEKTLQIIAAVEPTWWFIENPRGKLRKMPYMQGLLRHTVTYCQYGDTRQKPTDIWTNAWWWRPRAMCKRGDTCHEAAPRGSRTGTMGLKGATARGAIPAELFKEILEQMPNSG